MIGAKEARLCDWSVQMAKEARQARIGSNALGGSGSLGELSRGHPHVECLFLCALRGRANSQ